MGRQRVERSQTLKLIKGGPRLGLVWSVKSSQMKRKGKRLGVGVTGVNAKISVTQGPSPRSKSGND